MPPPTGQVRARALPPHAEQRAEDRIRRELGRSAALAALASAARIWSSVRDPAADPPRGPRPVPATS